MFEGNKGTNGPGVWQNDCTKVIHIDNQFLSNVGTTGSGGLEMNQGAAAISGCTFMKGTGAKGGGIYMQVGRSPARSRQAAVITWPCQL